MSDQQTDLGAYREHLSDRMPSDWQWAQDCAEVLVERIRFAGSNEFNNLILASFYAFQYDLFFENLFSTPVLMNAGVLRGKALCLCEVLSEEDGVRLELYGHGATTAAFVQGSLANAALHFPTIIIPSNVPAPNDPSFASSTIYLIASW